MLFSLLAESQQPTVPLSWEDLMRQLPLLAVALIVAWYSFRHITQQHEDHLNDIRKQTEKTLEMLADASARIEAAKDAELKAVQATLETERAEKNRLMEVLKSFGGTP